MSSMHFRITRTAVLYSVVAFLFAVLPSWAQMHSMSQMHSAADEAAIRKVVENYSTAFNNHDAHAVAMLYAENADFTNMYGGSQHGRPAIEKFYGGLFSGRLKNSHRTDTVKSVRLLSPMLADVDANWEMSGTTGANGKPNPVRKGMLTWIMAKRNGTWQILVFHEFDFPGQ